MRIFPSDVMHQKNKYLHLGLVVHARLFVENLRVEDLNRFILITKYKTINQIHYIQYASIKDTPVVWIKSLDVPLYAIYSP
jgi:hypothetical protein